MTLYYAIKRKNSYAINSNLLHIIPNKKDELNPIINPTATLPTNILKINPKAIPVAIQILNILDLVLQ